MLAVVLSAAVALLPHHSHAPASARQASNFPSRGIFVAGNSLAGVHIGDTQTRVKAVWGGRYRLCDPSLCRSQTWLYQYNTGEALGAAVVFEQGRVTAVFTLGSPAGWRTDRGLHIGDVINQVYQYYDTTSTTRCLGYDAISIRDSRTKIVTSFYSSSGYVYGFALTGPTQPVCQ